MSSVTWPTEDGIVLPHLFAKLPLTPKTNGHQQAAAELDLESLLPTTVELPKYAMNHGWTKGVATLSLSIMLRDLAEGTRKSESILYLF